VDLDRKSAASYNPANGKRTHSQGGVAVEDKISKLLKPFNASPEAKERLRVVLSVIGGYLTVDEACERLKMSEGEFDQLREDAMQGMLDGLKDA
jgi:hypothetical protein